MPSRFLAAARCPQIVGKAVHRDPRTKIPLAKLGPVASGIVAVAIVFGRR